MLPHEPNKNRVLGKLCVYNHEYKNTGKSLRYRNPTVCVTCMYLRQRERRLADPYGTYAEWRKNNKKWIAVYNERYRLNNPEKVNNKKYHKKYYLTVTKPKRREQREREAEGMGAVV